MSETIPATNELSPHAQALQAAVMDLVDNPPAGFSQPIHGSPLPGTGNEYTTSHTILSYDRVPGYPKEHMRSLTYQDGSRLRLALVRLPGEPLEGGTPTLREYTLYSNGVVSCRRSCCPTLEGIRNVERHIVGLVALLGGFGDYKDALSRAVSSATNKWIDDLQPASMGKGAHLSPEEVEALTRELHALAQPRSE